MMSAITSPSLRSTRSAASASASGSIARSRACGPWGSSRDEGPLISSFTSIMNNGVSLLRWSAYYGDVSAMKFLLANGEALTSLGENLDLNGAAFHGHWQL